MNISILKVISTKAIILLCMSTLFAQEVATKNGVLKGVTEDKIEVFKGVPFAAAPQGDLRWQAPKPFKSWNGVRLVNKFLICNNTKIGQS